MDGWSPSEDCLPCVSVLAWPMSSCRAIGTVRGQFRRHNDCAIKRLLKPGMAVKLSKSCGFDPWRAFVRWEQDREKLERLACSGRRHRIEMGLGFADDGMPVLQTVLRPVAVVQTPSCSFISSWIWAISCSSGYGLPRTTLTPMRAASARNCSLSEVTMMIGNLAVRGLSRTILAS